MSLTAGICPFTAELPWPRRNSEALCARWFGRLWPERPRERTAGMNIKAELAALERLTTGELVERYAALTGQPVRTGN